MSISRRTVAWLEQRLNLTEVFSFFTTFGLSYGTVDLNKPLEEAAREAFTRDLPTYTRGPYILGVLTFLVFILQAVTGLLLAFYYQPSPDAAYESTVLIIREANFGWYVHQMHYWGSNALIALLVVRLLRFFVDGVYKAPRELFWVFGAVLLLVAANEALTGTLLPWDQESYWTVTRGLEVVATLPVAGSVMSFLVGGFDVLSGTLLRFYVLHIIFIPLVMVFFFYLHFATVRKVGLSPLPEERRAEARPLYPDHLLQLMILSLLLFGAILTLGALFPAPFSAKADPFLSPPGAHPPWYLLPAFGLVDLLPHWFGGLLIVAACAALVFLPFIERSPHRESGRRRFFAGTAAAFCLVVIILAYIGYRRAV